MMCWLFAGMSSKDSVPKDGTHLAARVGLPTTIIQEFPPSKLAFFQSGLFLPLFYTQIFWNRGPPTPLLERTGKCSYCHIIDVFIPWN